MIFILKGIVFLDILPAASLSKSSLSFSAPRFSVSHASILYVVSFSSVLEQRLRTSKLTCLALFSFPGSSFKLPCLAKAWPMSDI